MDASVNHSFENGNEPRMTYGGLRNGETQVRLLNGIKAQNAILSDEP
jgi:hypothetical protein